MSVGPLLPGPMGLMVPGVRKARVDDAFDPLSIAGLHRWFDASQITGKVDSDPISSWTDLSGNGGHAVQATGANQPLYKTGILNGLPVVRADGTSDVLVAPKASDQTLTLFATGLLRSAVTNARLLALGSASAGIFCDASGNWKYHSDAVSAPIAVGGSATTAATITLKFTSASSLTTYRDGVVGATADPFDGYFSAANELVLFAQAAAGGGYGPVDLGEVLVYDSALGDTDRAAVEDYLSLKWGTP